MIKVALVKANGEVSHITSTQLDSMYVNRQMYGDLLAVHIPMESVNTDYINLRVWNSSTEQWDIRPEKSGDWYDWNAGSWQFNSDRFWIEVRSYRDDALNKTDWTQNADSPMGRIEKAEWAGYRQDLRNIPSLYPAAENFTDIVWPVIPVSGYAPLRERLSELLISR